MVCLQDVEAVSSPNVDSQTYQKHTLRIPHACVAFPLINPMNVKVCVSVCVYVWYLTPRLARSHPTVSNTIAQKSSEPSKHVGFRVFTRVNKVFINVLETKASQPTTSRRPGDVVTMNKLLGNGLQRTIWSDAE